MKAQQSYWREKAVPIIAKILQENPGKDEKELRKLLSAAYPFVMKKYHPYKIWCDEIKRQLGHKWPIGHKRAWENNQRRKKSEWQKLQEWNAIYGEGGRDGKQQ